MRNDSNLAIANLEATRPAFTAFGTCRVCENKRLVPVLDLEQQCLGNAYYRDGDEPSPSAPLELVRCNECSLVQLAHSVDASLFFSKNWKKPGLDQAGRKHLADLVNQAMQIATLCSGDTVIDIGCSDGASLSCYPADVHKIGIDPSSVAPEHCDHFAKDCFSSASVEQALAGNKAKIITSVAMFSALNDPLAFVESVAASLDPNGIWVLEMGYLPAMLRAVSYDTICHETVAYYRLRTFERLLAETGLEVFAVEFNGSRGGSFRLFVAPQGSRPIDERLAKARIEEANGLFDTRYPYEGFQTGVFRAKEAFMNFLHEVKIEGETVYGYGACTRGQVALQYCGLKPKQIVAIAERNPDKCGLFAPGSGIPICSVEQMRAVRPDYLVVFPWHCIDEILERETAYLRSGGKIVVPLPELRVYTGPRA